jgi:hypothetical protein
MKLGRLKKAGIDRFNDYLDQLEASPQTEFPSDLLSFPAYFDVIDEETEVISHKFSTRWEAARYLDSLFSTSGLTGVERDAPLWAALTAYYFDTLCPISPSGTRKIRERAAYLPEPENYKRYYRHLLLGPYLIYHAHRDNPARAMALLCKPPHVITDIEAQIAASQELVTNPAVVELATKLYYDPTTKSTKPGAGGKGAGSPRRYVSILRQFDMTWDLYAATTDELMDLLPKEFERYIK